MDNNLDNNQGGRRPDKGDPRRNQDPNRNKKNHQSILAFLICLLVTLVCFSLFTNMLQDNSSEITYDKFIDMVNNDEVKSVTLQSDTLTIVPKKQVSPYQEISYYTNLTEDETALTKRLEGTGAAGCIRRIYGNDAQRASAVCAAVCASDVLHAPHEQRRRWRHGRWEKPRQGLCPEGDRNHIQGCGRSGRGQGIPAGGCGVSP